MPEILTRNVTLVLAFVLAVVAAGIAGDRFGYTRGANAVEARYSKQKDKVNEALAKELEEAKEDAAEARRSAEASAQREAAAKKQLETALKGLRNAPPVPASCLSDALRLRLNAVVGTINRGLEAGSQPAGPVPGSLPAPAGSGAGG